MLVLGIFDNQIKVEGEGDDAVVSLEGEEICALDKSLGGLIAELVAESDFKAKVLSPPDDKSVCVPVVNVRQRWGVSLSSKHVFCTQAQRLNGSGATFKPLGLRI